MVSWIRQKQLSVGEGGHGSSSSLLEGVDGVGSRARSLGASGFDRRVWLLSLGTFAVGTDVLVVSGILPLVEAGLDVGLHAAGHVVTAYALVYALGAPVLAALTVRLPSDRVVVCALGLFMVANVLCALAPGFGSLLAARVLAGLAAALYTPTAYALAASLARPDRRASALAAVVVGMTVASLFGVPLGTLVGHYLGWRATFWFVAGLSAVALTVLLLSPPRAGEAEPQPTSVIARFAPLGQLAVLLALLPMLLLCIAAYTSYTYLGAALASRYRPEMVVLLFFAYGLGGLVGSQAGGWLADRFGTTFSIAALLAVAALNQALLGVAGTNIVTLAAGLFIWSFAGWAMFASQQSRLLAIEPVNRSVVLALNNSTIYLGAALGAAFGSLLLAQGVAPFDLHWANAGLLAMALFSFVAGLSLTSR